MLVASQTLHPLKNSFFYFKICPYSHHERKVVTLDLFQAYPIQGGLVSFNTLWFHSDSTRSCMLRGNMIPRSHTTKTARDLSKRVSRCMIRVEKTNSAQRKNSIILQIPTFFSIWSRWDNGIKKFDWALHSTDNSSQRVQRLIMALESQVGASRQPLAWNMPRQHIMHIMHI